MKKIFIILCTLSVLFYTNLNFAKEDERRISMDFQEAALRDVLKIFSQQAGLNFVASNEIEDKRITLYLDGVTVQDALDSIISVNNLTYEQKTGSSVFIVKESTMPVIEMITKVYRLNYAQVAPEIGYGEKYSYMGGGTDTDSGTSGGSYSGGYGGGYGGGGTSGTSGRSGRSGAIKDIIQNLLTKGEDDEPLGSVLADARTNSLIVTSIPEDFPLIEATLAKLDTRTLQVMIEAEIVEVKTSAIKDLGLEWGSTADGTFFTFTGPTRDTGFPFIRESGPFSRTLLGGSLADSRGRTLAATTTGTTFGNLSLTEFRVVLKALEQDNNAKYLAKPKIMVINNETAEIKIVEDTAIGTLVTSQTDTGTIASEAEREETGITLRVTPTINRDGYITMTLEPEVSRVQSSNIIGFWDPAKRSIKTTVMMKDGQTIAIGGLLKDDFSDNNRMVPGLSKIPLIGSFFKSKDLDDVTTEIIVFVTAHILKPESEITEAQVQLPPVRKEAAITDRDEEVLKAVRRLRKKREIE